jgi:hypothetical protein
LYVGRCFVPISGHAQIQAKTFHARDIPSTGNILLLRGPPHEGVGGSRVALLAARKKDYKTPPRVNQTWRPTQCMLPSIKKRTTAHFRTDNANFMRGRKFDATSYKHSMKNWKKYKKARNKLLSNKNAAFVDDNTSTMMERKGKKNKLALINIESI